MSKPKIFIFTNGSGGSGVDFHVHADALAEDGTFVAQHLSSSITWAKHDMGVDRPGSPKHKTYARHYPDGYEIVWVEPEDARDKTNAGLNAAYDVHVSRASEENASE